MNGVTISEAELVWLHGRRLPAEARGCELTSVAALHMVYRCSGPSARCPWIMLVPTKKMHRSAGVQAAAGGLAEWVTASGVQDPCVQTAGDRLSTCAWDAEDMYLHMGRSHSCLREAGQVQAA